MAQVKMRYAPDRLNDIMAHKGFVRRELRSQANKRANVARAILAIHRHEGHVTITVKRGSRLDYFVNMEDRDNTKGSPAAAAIEFGHVAANGRFVEGIHALTSG
jgi:Family of unknown function (DUF5403)